MKTRHFLTVAEKIEILDYHEKYKEISMRNLSAIFSQKYEKNVTKSVIHRITQQKLTTLCSRQAIPKISREDYFLV